MSIVVATIVKRKSDDGLIELQPDVELGKKFKVELNSRRVVVLENLEFGKLHRKEIIDTYPYNGWLPLELIELGGVP